MNLRNGQGQRFGPGWRAAIWALILFKLWLVAGLGVRAMPPETAGRDDWLFLQYAEHLLQGEWLGPYNNLTLAKGPFFSLFIASAFLLHVPLLLAKATFHAAACVLFVVAWRPLVAGCGWRLAMFAVLLFNPITYCWDENMRVVRQGVLSALVLLILAGLIGLYARRELPLRRQWPWAVLLGSSLSAFWLTREDSVWILPVVVPVWVYLVWAHCRSAAVPAAAVAQGVDAQVSCLKSEVQSPESGGEGLAKEDGESRIENNKVDAVHPPPSILQPQSSPSLSVRLAVMVAVPLLLWGVGMGVVSYQNWRHYGVWTTCEFKHPSFKAAYGALLRVKPEREIPFVPVTRETRQRIYAVSPAFAQLRPYLEGALGEDWARNAGEMARVPREQLEIGAAWFVWALRDAVELAGPGRSGRTAAAYYAQLAREVNDACDRGLLPAGRKRAGFLPPLTSAQIGPVLKAMGRGLGLYFTFTDIEMMADEPSRGTPESLFRFTTLTRGRLTRAHAGTGLLSAQWKWDRARITALGIIHRGYAWVMPWIGAAGVAALLAAVALAVKRRRLSFFLVLSLGCAAATVALVAICALVDVTSFGGIGSTYQTGGYNTWLMFLFAGFLALAQAVGWDCKPNESQPVLISPAE